MYQVLDTGPRQRLDASVFPQARVLFGTTFALAALASPLFVLYESLLGVLGLVATGLVARVKNGTGPMAATVVFAGLVAGSLPYFLAAPFLS